MSPGVRIRADRWGHRYPGSARPVLDGVSFQVDPGELVVLMGASGSGKSTLLAAIAGTLPIGTPAGSLEVAEAAAGYGGRADAREACGSVSWPRLGLVQQEPEGNIVMELVGDDLAFPLENAAVPAGSIWPRARAAAEAVGLDVALTRPTSSLSGGQQQLLAVAAATVARPGLLLLDEPTANLDQQSAEAVRTAVGAVRQATGCTVVVVEHRVEEWLAAADSVLLADGGTITQLRPGGLGPQLASRPALARRLWLDHRGLPFRGPLLPAGPVRISARGIGMADRLPALDVAARAGEVVALTGPPGSGKSTLLACLGGLLEPTCGRVEVRDPTRGAAAPVGDAEAACEPRVDPWRWASADVAATFGVVFQNPEHQFVTGSAVEELRHGLAVAGVAEPEAAHRASTMLDRLGLAHLAGANPFTLSGGEQRRLSVATALVLDPGILLLDEPTFGQDPTTWAEMVDIIAGHRDAGGTVVMATHDPHLVRALGAREVCLGPGDQAGTDHPGGEGPTGAPRLRDPEAGSPTGSLRGPGSSEAGSPAGALRRLGDGQAGPPAGALRRLDPFALVGGAGLVSIAGLVSVQAWLNVLLAGACLAAALAGGLPARRVLVLGAPALLASLSVGLSNVLLSPAGPLAAQSWSAAAIPATRVLAVALPGLVAAVALDATAMADALVVRLRVPARAAYSALAGLRLIPLLADEWAILGRASRARGLGGRGVRARARQFASMTFRLLVAALRRGARLAIALDARGLGSGPRTVARPRRWVLADTAVVIAGACAMLVALMTSR